MRLNNSFKWYKPFRFILIALAIPGVIYLLAFFLLGGVLTGKTDITSGFSPGAPLIFAHRGVATTFPENSLESVAEAVKHGFAAVEFDLRKTANGDFILFHDADCQRLLGKQQKINEITTGELRNFPLLMDGKPTVYYVPLLEEVLDRYGDTLVFYFDMKLSSFRDADQIVQIIRRHGIEKSVIVASADAMFIFYLGYRYGDIITALEGFNAGKEWTYNLIPRKLKPDFLSGFIGNVTDSHVKWLRKRGLLSRRIVYGIDSTNFDHARESGLENVILDYNPASRFFKGKELFRQSLSEN